MPTRIDRVDQRDRALERQRQRVDRRDREERDLDRVLALELIASQRPGGLVRVLRSRYQAMKTTIDQPMPISSRLAPVMLASASEHGDSVAGTRRDGQTGAELLEGVAALAREDEVDRVLGQHRDERQDGDREPGRDVELRDLGRPGEQEGRADDREAEQRAPRARADVSSRANAQDEGRDRGERGGRQRCALAAGMYVDKSSCTVTG